MYKLVNVLVFSSITKRVLMFFVFLILIHQIQLLNSCKDIHTLSQYPFGINK